MAFAISDAYARPVLALNATRKELLKLDWSDVSASAAQSNMLILETKGRTDEVATLSLGDDPELLGIATQVAEALSLPLDPVAGRRPG